jgi:hypothetical protein
MHYMRWWEHGDQTFTHFKKCPDGAPLSFIKSAKDYEGEDCLIWPYAKNNKGYGQINTSDGKKKLAHRMICELAHGSPSEDMQALHRCGNGHLGCVAPNHLYWGTIKQNVKDMVAHGRSARGRTMAGTPLTEEQVMEIFSRAHSGEIQERIAGDFGIAQSSVSHIKHGKAWGWLTGASPA